MLRFGKLAITPGFWILLEVTLLVGAWEVLPIVVLAAALHELGHIAALYWFGVPVQEISFTTFGAEIKADTRYIPYWKDILCTLAGPGINLFAAFLLSRTSEAHLFAGANLLQGCFNLLPLTGLDGSRALHLMISRLLDPVRADRIVRIVELVSAALLAGGSIYLVVRHQTGGFLLMAVLGVMIGIWRDLRGK